MDCRGRILYAGEQEDDDCNNDPPEEDEDGVEDGDGDDNDEPAECKDARGRCGGEGRRR